MSHKITKNSLLVIVLIGMSGCISGVQPEDSYTDRNGKTTVFQTDAEACIQGCNDDYSRCMDASASDRSAVHAPSGMFGTSADCHSDLKDCLPSCKGR